MKVNLIVTAVGPNQGRAIPIAGEKFIIGRDPECNLRPASQAISKQHCALLIRSGKVFVLDLSSTNGTVVNDVAVSGEQEVVNGDRLKIGPLDFKIDIVPTKPLTDSTPLPESLKAVSPSSAEKLKAVVTAPIPASKSLPPLPTTPVKITRGPPVVNDDSSEHDDAAAMLLGMDDDAPGSVPQVPDGSTVMDVPTVNADGTIAKKVDKKKLLSGAEMSSAANDILRKYIRRSS
jgi:pSer/pThr/pTyr-binding forkhead associated (FHA) protein